MTTNGSGTDTVEAAWQELLDSDRVSAELVVAAYAEPRLRQLFPWIGMWELHFSRCTEQRWTWDVPYIGPAAAGPDHAGPYYVEGPSRTQKIGRAGTAREAVAMVVERLPSNRGPAFNGTPEELATHELMSVSGLAPGQAR
ncbi:DUF6193 family natural product biosynthesis protein [Streptomyces brevispora]|uniref:Uncharacterized protein n=1 Tax=Streptomyces brevispora TaxID=887462 RepID=A0A561UY51_9ACTN|nr:DUF6193 family natural product biosynthesis protein [Streptomyces brevispora]TWG04288.1 hypothetical protein FHX80_112732 [Streptomyces brevispora]